MQSCIHVLLAACSFQQLVEVMSRQVAMNCFVASISIQMCSIFPFEEMLLGPRCNLLGKKLALCDIPKQHWFGYCFIWLLLAGKHVQSDTVNISSWTRSVIHYDDKSFKDLLFFVPKDWWVHTEPCKYFWSLRIHIPSLPCNLFTLSTESRNNITSSESRKERNSFRFHRAACSGFFWKKSSLFFSMGS